MNHKIRVPEVRLIDHLGHQMGVVGIQAALSAAQTAGLDLVEIAPEAKPPVCRIMDYGKHIYEHNKKRALSKKKQQIIQVKEVKFRPSTDVGDYTVKVDHIEKFLRKNCKVRVNIRFRGRELQHKDLAIHLMNRIQSDLSDLFVLEQEPKLEGKQMGMLLGPSKSARSTQSTQKVQTSPHKEPEKL